MARSHYHLRFRGSFGGEGVGDNPGCSPELTGAGFVGLVRVGGWLCGYSIEVGFESSFHVGLGARQSCVVARLV